MNPLALERFIQPLLPYFFGLWMLIVIYFTMAPDLMVKPATRLLNPGIGHVILFGGWTTLLGFTLLISFKRSNISLLILWIAGVLFGGFIEILQSILPFERDGNWLDVGLNAIGCTLAVLIILLYRGYRNSYIERMKTQIEP